MLLLCAARSWMRVFCAARRSDGVEIAKKRDRRDETELAACKTLANISDRSRRGPSRRRPGQRCCRLFDALAPRGLEPTSLPNERCLDGRKSTAAEPHAHARAPKVFHSGPPFHAARGQRVKSSPAAFPVT